MKIIGEFKFPETHDEVAQWHRIISFRALHQCVLCVARTRIEGTWCAYCKNVPGVSHPLEIDDVLKHGDKMSKNLASLMFPQFEGIPYAE